MAAHAPSLAARNARFLLALAPGAVLACASFSGLGWRLAGCALFALFVESACLRLRRLPLRPYLAEGAALRAAVLLALWLPTAPLPWLLAALVAGLLTRQWLGGLGAHPFHAAMIAAALAQLAGNATPMPADAGSPWLPLAFLAGGLALCASGQVRWPGPLALLAAAALAAWPLGNPLGVPTSAPWLLAAFFVLPEPGGSGEHLKSRIVLGALAGAAAALAGQGVSAVALPFALLAANALASVLDRRLAPRRASAA
jgi:electron transport complex protein RnfD